MSTIKRVFVEKKNTCRIESEQLLEDLKHNLKLNNLEEIRILNRYDMDNVLDQVYEQALYTIFSERTVDLIYEETVNLSDDELIFGIEYLPGQYDQRADSCEQCIKLLSPDSNPVVRTAKMILLKGKLAEEEIAKIKSYCINPVDSREAKLEIPQTLEMKYEMPEDIKTLIGFTNLQDDEIDELWTELGLAMTKRDLKFTRDYFKNEERRDPSITEIRVLDTYWSDHCRHSTFLTKITKVDFEDGYYNTPTKKTYEKYLNDRKEVFGSKTKEKDVCLMDLALLAMRKLRKEGKLDDLEISDEINACSIIVDVDISGKNEEWLIMFKNETHNHPTEIEPFGGAATCLGGAIRDPLSGRSYVYQAMRVTGAADPRGSIEETLPGKLPQKKIVTESAHGYSSYGNQIGLATGQVREIYHPNYVAKRMEIGAVIGATPRKNVMREDSEEGDIIVLLGGRTGRDGCGGATGSSKEHTEDSIHTCGAEVQKGNPPTERKIQRLFRQEKVSTLIKKCNDFGAGGVSVAIGELADGLIINLDAVPKKYAGLDGTELAISESQERMAVVLDQKDVEKFIKYADDENLEATVVAMVTKEKRLIMKWKEKTIVDISREFLDTNGATDETEVFVNAPDSMSYFEHFNKAIIKEKTFNERWIATIKDLNVCSQKGLAGRFDSSIGASTVNMPFGGKYQLTPIEAMVAKIPLEKGDTTTGTAMSYGYNPFLTSWSPFHGAAYGIIESIAKIVAVGGNYSKIRFTFQEYFKRLYKDAKRWGEPFSAMLGAYYVQDMLGLPSIGGKDSMSGTFHDIDVPPTLVSFAVNIVDVNKVISPEFKKVKSKVLVLPMDRDSHELPDFKQLKKNYSTIYNLIGEGKVLSAHSVGIGGISEAITKMSFGNMIGINLNKDVTEHQFFSPDYGSIILEIEQDEEIDKLLEGINYYTIGITNNKATIEYRNNTLKLQDLLISWEETLETIFPTRTKLDQTPVIEKTYQAKNIYMSKNKIARPKVFIPIFPGTNCEYDSKKSFEEAGADVKTFVFRNLNSLHVEESVNHMAKLIKESNIVMLPGGFSAGDEPEGSGKFIATIFRNTKIKESVLELLNKRDGLMLGICNGFQALIKLGLVPNGSIVDIKENSPTLTYNTIGRHISCMVHTKVISNKSPWLSNVQIDDVFSIPVSHGEGRFLAPHHVVEKLFENGQIATVYVDMDGKPSMEIEYNPNGSVYAVEGITSPDGRIFGKMGHSERIGKNVFKNIIGNKDQRIFKSGVEYFTK